MIQFYSGTPGSGKSLHMAKDIYWYANMKKEKLIITNFEVDVSRLKNPDRVVMLDNKQLKHPDILYDLAYDFNGVYGLKENNIILMIDEAQLLFNARTWNEVGRDQWLVFFTQHRKLGFMVILSAQFDGMIDKQIRALIEYQTIHRKCSNYGLYGLFLKLFCFGQDLFVGVETWYQLKERTNLSFYFARKKYYSLYDTYNLFSEK